MSLIHIAFAGTLMHSKRQRIKGARVVGLKATIHKRLQMSTETDWCLGTSGVEESLGIHKKARQWRGNSSQSNALLQSAPVFLTGDGVKMIDSSCLNVNGHRSGLERVRCPVNGANGQQYVREEGFACACVCTEA